MLTRTPHLPKKIKEFSEDSEHNFEGGANSELDKDTDESNLDSNVKYLSLALTLNNLFLMFSSEFNCCNIRFGIKSDLDC